MIGTPPNIVITNALRGAGLPSFSFFEFSLIGIPLLIVVIAYMLLVGRHWLPARQVADQRVEMPASPEELTEAYQLEDNLFRLRVRRGSSIAGQTLREAGIGRDHRVTVVRIERAQAEKEFDPLHPHQKALDNLTDTLQIRRLDPDTLTPGADTRVFVDDVMLVNGSEAAVQETALAYLGLPMTTRPLGLTAGPTASETLR
jgi:hypothetical protein